jgi:hypothetical protein
MTKIYYYKLTADDGGAPCVQDGLLSLAICKPMIRSKAERGDLIFGFAANSVHRDNRLIYVARVTDTVKGGAYYVGRRFARRGDCVYVRRGGRFFWRQGSLYHGPEHLRHDLGEHPRYPKADVLLSADFRYFGANGNSEYKSRYPRIKEAVERLGQGFRVWHKDALRQELQRLKDDVWEEFEGKIAGEPTTRPRLGVCHRSRSCGVIA